MNKPTVKPVTEIWVCTKDVTFRSFGHPEQLNKFIDVSYKKGRCYRAELFLMGGGGYAPLSYKIESSKNKITHISAFDLRRYFRRFV